MRDAAVPSTIGRPSATTHAAIEEVAFRLFARDGFEATTLDLIAAEVGVGRRTLFRYFASKNDIPWGRFDRTLDGFRTILAATPADLPLYDAVCRGVVAFNRFPPDASPGHRDRMRLILRTPALQAHSVHRYVEWRAVIAGHVATRLGIGPDTALPRLMGHVSLALALTAYEEWLDDPSASLTELLARSMSDLVRIVGGGDPSAFPPGAGQAVVGPCCGRSRTML